MSKTIEVKIPDIGDFKEVAVIEVMVKPGDTINVEDSIITLESDKATMDVPSPAAGTVKDVKVKTGDNVAEGTVVLTLEVAEGAVAPVPAKPAAAAAAPARVAPAPEPSPQGARTAATGAPPAPGHTEGPMAPPPVVAVGRTVETMPPKLVSRELIVVSPSR